MKNVFSHKTADGYEIVARFGEATLVRRSNGQYELVGGRKEDHFNAREWASLFMHEAIVDAPLASSAQRLVTH
jgi:hypothetical protein